MSNVSVSSPKPPVLHASNAEEIRDGVVERLFDAIWDTHVRGWPSNSMHSLSQLAESTPLSQLADGYSQWAKELVLGEEHVVTGSLLQAELASNSLESASELLQHLTEA